MTTAASEPESGNYGELATLRERDAEITKSADRCAALWRILEEKKADAKEAKENYESAVTEHFALVREKHPLFDHAASNGHASAKPADPPFPSPSDESWREAMISELGLAESIRKKLADADADIVTIGDLQKFIEEASKNGHSDPIATIKGIGSASAEKIAEAVAEFWKRRGMSAPSAASSAPSPPSPPGDGDGEAAIPPISDLPVAPASIMELELPVEIGERVIKALVAKGVQTIEDLEREAKESGNSIADEARRICGFWLSKKNAKAIEEAVAKFRVAETTAPKEEAPETTDDEEGEDE